MFGAGSLGSVIGVGAAGGFRGLLIPILGFTIIAPDSMLSSRRGMILHRKIMKDVLKTVLLEWHAGILPGHFEPQAAQTYGHQKRQEATIRIKQAKYHHATDLVQAGRTRRHMTGRMPKVITSGTADRLIEGRIVYGFPFPVSRDAKNPAHVTMVKMGSEIASWSQQDMTWAIERFAELYAALWEWELERRPKMKMQTQAAKTK